MRIAAFNVENMFSRPVALDPLTRAANRPVLEAFAQLQRLLEQETYGDADKVRIVELLDVLGLKLTDESEWAYLRAARGRLLIRRRDASRTVDVSADGRGDWIGWVELKREAVNEQATRNTARIIAELGADVLAVVEAEDRPTLSRFNRDVLPLGFTGGTAPWRYRHAMLIDGNDDRGIDVGVMTAEGHPIVRTRSHVDDVDDRGELLFSRDCPEFEIDTPGGRRVLVLVNHFKSKGYGSPRANDARRLRQAARVAEIYAERRDDGVEHIAVVGDLNDTPGRPPLAPLLRDTDLRDVSAHPAYQDDGRTGTFGTSRDKLDYLLLSPALFDAVQSGGVERRGVWHGPRVQNPWKMLDTLTAPEEAASDHAAIWADVDV